MIENVERRLTSLGYEETSEDDKWLIKFLIDKVASRIKGICNVREIPKPLHAIWIDMTCGEFLLVKKQSGRLDGFCLETAVKQVQEGDVTVSFAIGEGSNTPEQRLDKLIAWLLACGESELAHYRKVRW